LHELIHLIAGLCNKYNTSTVGAIKFVSDPKSIGTEKLYATTKYNFNPGMITL